MSYFNKRTSSGVFIPQGNGFIEYKRNTGSGSINDTAKSLGYHPDQVYCHRYALNSKETVQAVFFELFSRNIVFVMTSTTTTYFTEKDVRKHLGDFSLSKEFTSIRINDDLAQGVENSSLPVSFMAKVLRLENVSNNGMFYSDKIKAYLYFTDGVLSNFHFDDGLFPWAKHLREFNPQYFKKLSDTAYKYWQDDFQAKKEINLQCEAWSNIPDGFRNKYLPVHKSENGAANIYMLRVCHYEYPIDLLQFKEINHGRYISIEENDSLLKYKCGRFEYTFESDTGKLKDIVQTD